MTGNIRGHRVRDYEDRLTTLLNEDRVLGSLLDHAEELFQTERAAFYRPGPQSDRLVLQLYHGTQPAPVIYIHPALRETVRKLRHVLDPDQLAELAPPESRGPILDRLEELGFCLFVPVSRGDALEGVLALGPPFGRPSFARRERRALTRLAVRAGAALGTARLHRDEVARERLERDLEVARGIQRGLLPRDPPRRIRLEIGAVSHSCEAVGGDFYDFVDFADGRVGLAIGDVSGKGIGAALLMATVHAAFHAEADRTASPGAVLRRLNLMLLDRKDVGKFVCLFYGILDADGKRLVYANAGVEPPILARGDGSWCALTEGNLILGVQARTVYEDHEVALNPGDRLLVFSDGLLEHTVPGGPAAPEPEEDGFPGYAGLVTALNGGRGSPREAMRRVLREAHLADPSAPPDDVTLVLVRTWS